MIILYKSYILYKLITFYLVVLRENLSTSTQGHVRLTFNVIDVQKRQADVWTNGSINM